MAQTSRSTDIKATRAMRDATNSVAPRDIAPKPPAEGKENDKDDGFFFADPAGLTTPAPALPAKTMDPSPTSVLMGPGTPDEAAEQRPSRDATPEKATDDGDDAEMTLATSDISDGESVDDVAASPESPERPATVPERVGSTSPFVPNVLEELLGAQLPRATPPGEPTVRARRESGNLAAPAPQSQTRRATGAQHAASTPPPTSTRWRSVPSPAQIVSVSREWAATSSANGPTPGRSSRPLPTFLDDLVAAGRAKKVSVDDKGTNTESNESDEHRDRTEDLKLECERLKLEVDFHRDVSREVGVSLDASAAELERTKRRVEFLESLKDEWDAQFKELSAETERYRAEADAAREETLAAEALAAAARAAATSASAEAESLRRNVDDKNDASSTGEALGELSSGTTSTSASATSTSEVGSAALFRRHRSGAENDVAASIAAALRERESELDQTRLRLDQTLAAFNAAEAKLAAKREECAALRGEVNVAKSASAAAREATAQTEGALVTTLEDKKRLVKKIEAMEAEVDAAARDASERVRDATERGRRSASRARANWGAAALTTAALALCVCAWAAAVPPAGVSFSVPFVHPRDWLAIGGAGSTPRFVTGSAAQTIAKPSIVKRVNFTLPGAGYAVAERLSSCRADLATTATTATRLALEASRFAGLAKENDRLSNEVKDFARVAESLREREADVTHLESRLAHLESAANDAATRGDDPIAASVAARAETERLRHALAKERTLRRRSASLEKLDVVSIAAVCVAWVTCVLSAWFFASQERGLRRSLNDYGALMEAASAEHERLGTELTSATLDANEERTRRERLEGRTRELERQLDASRRAANEATKRVEAFEAIGRRERERERDGARSAERRFGKASSFGGGKSVTWDDDVSIAPSTTTTTAVDARAGAQTPEAAARPHNTVFKPPVSFQ